MVDDAIARGEIPSDTDAAAVVNMLLAMFLGMGFYAGFIVDRNDMAVIAKQLQQLMARGLLDLPKGRRSAHHHTARAGGRPGRRFRRHKARADG